MSAHVFTKGMRVTVLRDGVPVDVRVIEAVNHETVRTREAPGMRAELWRKNGTEYGGGSHEIRPCIDGDEERVRIGREYAEARDKARDANRRKSDNEWMAKGMRAHIDDYTKREAVYLKYAAEHAAAEQEATARMQAAKDQLAALGVQVRS